MNKLLKELQELYSGLHESLVAILYLQWILALAAFYMFAVKLLR